MIQQVQEKLSMLVNNPETNLDRELAPPMAVLSINSAVCSSTGFSPFELMFGRSFSLLPQTFTLEDEEMSEYVNSKREVFASRLRWLMRFRSELKSAPKQDMTHLIFQGVSRLATA